MENGLPASIEELRVELEFYQALEKHLEAIRTSPRLEVTGYAAREVLRVRERLSLLLTAIKRLEGEPKVGRPRKVKCE